MDADHIYDVFLSHDRVDAALVEKLAARLVDERGLKVWLDKWVLIPGNRWQQEMAKGLEAAKCCAVCIGSQTSKGWFKEEIQAALDRQNREPSFRVIPIILPGGDSAYVDTFLKLRTWVDFRAGIDDGEAFHILVSGIKGDPPGRYTPASPLPVRRTEEHALPTDAAPPPSHAEGGPGTASPRVERIPIVYQGPRIMGRPFPELRKNFIAALANELGASSEVHILFVAGRPGVGKSHLCAALAGRLVQNHGAQVHYLDVVHDAGPLLRRISASLFPSSPVPATADLPTLLVQSTRRRLLHISNCQDLSVQDIQALASLFAELESQGWGSVQFLLESRTVSGRSRWRTFVKEISTKLPGSREVTVEALKARHVVRAVDELFLTDQAERVAYALMGKAGGNPLLLINILQHLVTQGVLRWDEDSTREYLTVQDPSSFLGGLNEIPAEIRPLLRERIEQYKPGDGREDSERLPYAERLALLAAVGPDFDPARVAYALGVSASDLHDMDLTLVKDEFLTYVGVGDRVDFSQEVMRLAAEDYGRNDRSFWRVADRLIEQMNEHTAREEVLAGTLYLWIHHHEKALSCYRAALDLAKQSGDYSLQRAALVGCIRSSESRIPDSLALKKEFIDWRVDLGWNEMQAGSQKQALGYLENALKLAYELLDRGYNERLLLRQEDTRIRQRILTCLLDRQQIAECLGLLESLVPAITDVKHLFDTMNRFVLLCFMTGEASAGFEAACLGWELAERLDDESRSVILSDIGHLFLLQAPDVSAQLWKDCLEAAQEVRQKTHAKANCRVAHLLTLRERKDHTVNDLIQTVQTETGTSIQLARLYMFAGTQFALASDWDSARVYFDLARSNAVAYGLISSEWEAYNNLGVAYIALNEQTLANQSFALAASRIRSVLKDRSSARISALSRTFAAQTRKLSGFDLDSISNRISQLTAPTSTGLVWSLLYNLEQTQRRDIPVSLPKDFWMSVDQVALTAAVQIIDSPSNPLRVRTDHGNFALALA